MASPFYAQQAPSYVAAYIVVGRLKTKHRVNRMKITQKTKLLLVVCILLFSTSGAHAEKIKLLCNVDIQTDYSTGYTSKGKEKIQVDIESIKDHLFISTNGIDIGFSMSNVPSELTDEKNNSSDTNMFELDFKRPAKSDGEGVRREYLKIDRNSGILYYRYIGRLTKTATGSCSKLNQKKLEF